MPADQSPTSSTASAASATIPTPAVYFATFPNVSEPVASVTPFSTLCAVSFTISVAVFVVAPTIAPVVSTKPLLLFQAFVNVLAYLETSFFTLLNAFSKNPGSSCGICGSAFFVCEYCFLPSLLLPLFTRTKSPILASPDENASFKAAASSGVNFKSFASFELILPSFKALIICCALSALTLLKSVPIVVVTPFFNFYNNTILLWYV